VFVFVSGGVRSGKSAWAEEYALALADLASPNAVPLIYLATARVSDQEMRKRVLLHQAARKDKGFETLERDVNITAVFPRLVPSATVLLECLGTLLANELFGTGESMDAEETASKIYQELLSLKAQTANLLVVSNDVFSDGVTYNEATENYRRVLGALHARLALEADLAAECVCGLAIIRKGEKACPGYSDYV
jgi:adenosylcobinamide kinase/adenosylcobinamide-phosphate guanylyltransferase